MAWLSDALGFTSRRQPRVAERRVIFLNAKLRSGDGWRDVQIGNISTSGFMLRADEPPKLDEVIEVRHRGWSAVGKVVWRSGFRVGVQALAPIDDSDPFAPSELGHRENGSTNNARTSTLRRLRSN